MTAGETATEYDPSGHLLISFLGNYQQQEPDEALMEILARLIARLCKLYNISPDTIATHRDYSKMTTCPGKYLYPYFQDKSVKKRVKKLLGKR
ncbi:MAG: N-acetylmuramoyl-L-alanine amidase [Chitinophagaceae bacterium]|nr:N-acetylmuramoyl-L-alanine amidase [Chitinophagaceae bacterium]